MSVDKSAYKYKKRQINILFDFPIMEKREMNIKKNDMFTSKNTFLF